VDKLRQVGIDMKTHGYSAHPLYNVYNSILARCYCKTNNNYDNYGARGIRLCDEWKNDRTLFFRWALENGWKQGLCTDRIDVNGNYEPSNCRFITRSENSRTKRPRNHWKNTLWYNEQVAKCRIEKESHTKPKKEGAK
jgi:hypothetical protein